MRELRPDGRPYRELVHIGISKSAVHRRYHSWRSARHALRAAHDLPGRASHWYCSQYREGPLQSSPGGTTTSVGCELRLVVFHPNVLPLTDGVFVTPAALHAGSVRWCARIAGSKLPGCEYSAARSPVTPAWTGLEKLWASTSLLFIATGGVVRVGQCVALRRRWWWWWGGWSAAWSCRSCRRRFWRWRPRRRWWWAACSD